MKKIPYHNTQNHAVFIGGVMVPSGETRLVDGSLLPPVPHQHPETVAADPLAELLKGKVDEITAQLEHLSLDELERLGDMEQTGQQRKGVLGAVAERLLALSAEQQEQG